MLANGLASMLGCLMGNPFPVTVYVGHPGWKAMGASIGYTGVRRDHVHRAAVRAGAFMLAIIPMTAIVPILVFIGVVTANRGEGNPESGGARHLHLPVPVDRQLGADHDEQRDERRGDQRGENWHRRAAQQGDLLRRLDASRQRRAARQHALGLYRHLRHYQQTAARGRRRRRSALLALFGVIHAPVVGFAEGSSLMFVTAYLMMGGMFVVKHVLDTSVNPLSCGRGPG